MMCEDCFYEVLMVIGGLIALVGVFAFLGILLHFLEGRLGATWAIVIIISFLIIILLIGYYFACCYQNARMIGGV